MQADRLLTGMRVTWTRMCIVFKTISVYQTTTVPFPAAAPKRLHKLPDPFKLSSNSATEDRAPVTGLEGEAGAVGACG